MINLQQIEADLVTALKSRNQLAADTLRALKTRIQNEQISKMKELTDTDILALVQSEVKKRKEAADSFVQGDRAALADKELAEAEVLSKYLPAQVSEADIAEYVDTILAANTFGIKDLGKVIAELKQHYGPSADGATLAKIVKEKLK